MLLAKTAGAQMTETLAGNATHAVAELLARLAPVSAPSDLVTTVTIVQHVVGTAVTSALLVAATVSHVMTAPLVEITTATTVRHDLIEMTVVRLV
jgi:hypothetical protein